MSTKTADGLVTKQQATGSQLVSLNPAHKCNDGTGKVERLCAEARNPLRADLVKASGLTTARREIGLTLPSVRVRNSSSMPFASTIWTPFGV